jgi:hypothetical protein
MSALPLMLPLAVELAEPCPEPAPPVVPAPVSGVRWADPERVRAPSPALTLEWAIWQLVPSPELGFGDGGALFGLRWQLTPLLYSFALDRRFSRWRAFIAEPIVRHSGSIELFVSPEYLARDAERFGVRAGVRSYFGLLHRGDYLSVSLATAYVRFGKTDAASHEVGAYVLFGMLGLQVGYTPAMEDASWLMTLRLRFF